MPSDPDKRKHQRFFCETVTKIRNMDSKEVPAYHDAVVADISEGGIRLSSPRFIAIHHRLAIKIEMPRAKTIETVVKPVWIREIPSTGRFEIGTRFLTISDDDLGVIRDYARALFKDQARPASSARERA